MSALAQPPAPPASASMPAPPAVAQPISPSERLLFSSNHWQALIGAPLPLTLRYSLSSHGGDVPAHDDEVTLTVTQLHADATAEVALHFLSSAGRRDLPPLGHAMGNPVLLAFLEHDIGEMARLTGGQAAYFRRRIRLALASSALLTPCTFTYRGKVMQGQEIQAQPYKDDPRRDRYAGYADKRYGFILSTQVPGGVYQIHTASGTATATAPAPAPREETLTLLGEQR